jgi:hypothetical protein
LSLNTPGVLPIAGIDAIAASATDFQSYCPLDEYMI